MRERERDRETERERERIQEGKCIEIQQNKISEKSKSYHREYICDYNQNYVTTDVAIPFVTHVIFALTVK